MAVGAQEVRVGFTVSDPAEFGALARWLEGNGGVRVEREPAAPSSGELGVPDLATAVGGTSAVIAALKMIPAFIRSRRSDIHVEATVRGEKYTFDLKNVDEKTAKMVERLMRE